MRPLGDTPKGCTLPQKVNQSLRSKYLKNINLKSSTEI